MSACNHVPSLSSRLDRHFVACAAAATAAGALLVDRVEAGIVYSGIRDIVVSNVDSTGLYVDMETGLASFPGSSVPGYDFNIFNLGTSVPPPNGVALFAPATTAWVGYNASGYAYADRLAAGVTVSGASAFNTPVSGNTTMVFDTYGPWQGVTTDGYLGFKFDSGGSTRYGWARVSLSGPTAWTITVHDWAYEDTGASIETGAVPEPASLGLLAAGALGLALRRSKKHA